MRASSHRAAASSGPSWASSGSRSSRVSCSRPGVADGDQAEAFQGRRAALVAGDLAEHVPLADPQRPLPGVGAGRVLIQAAGLPAPEDVLDQAVEAGRRAAVALPVARRCSVISRRIRSARARSRRYPAWNAVSCRESANTSSRRSISSSLCAASPACRLNAIAVIAAAVRAVNSSTAPALRPYPHTGQRVSVGAGLRLGDGDLPGRRAARQAGRRGGRACRSGRSGGSGTRSCCAVSGVSSGSACRLRAA